MALGHSSRGSRQLQEACNPCFPMLTSVKSWFNWLHKSDTLPWLCLVGDRNRFPAVGWAEDMGTSRASNAALQRQFPHGALTAQAVEPGGEGNWAVLLPAWEDLQTPIRLCGAGSTLLLLPVLPLLLASPLCQPALLTGNLTANAE